MQPDQSPAGTRDFSVEFTFQATRSSGAGGQHVNKVSSRVELRFNIPASQLLNDNEKQLLLEKLKSRLTKDGELLLACEETRSQYRNKQACIDKFYDILNQALRPAKKRLPTRPTKASRLKRLEQKKTTSLKKQRRRMSDE